MFRGNLEIDIPTERPLQQNPAENIKCIKSCLTLLDGKFARLKMSCRPGTTSTKTVGGGDSPHGVFNPPPPWLAKVSRACLNFREPCPSRTFQNCKSFSTRPMSTHRRPRMDCMDATNR